MCAWQISPFSLMIVECLSFLGVCAPGDVVGLAAAACGPALLRSWSGSPELSRGRCSRYKGACKVVFRGDECVRAAETDLLVLQAVKLTSSRTQLPYEYYSLPFCKPDAVFYKGENLGES